MNGLLPPTWQQRMRIAIGRFMSSLQGTRGRLDSGISYIQFPLDHSFNTIWINAYKQDLPFFLRAIDPTKFYSTAGTSTKGSYLRLYVSIEIPPHATIAWVEIVSSPSENGRKGFRGLVHVYPDVELEFLWRSAETRQQFYALYRDYYPESSKRAIDRLMVHDQAYQHTAYLISLRMAPLAPLQEGESYEEYSITRIVTGLEITAQNEV